MRSTLQLCLPLLLLACDSSSSADRGPIGPADALGSCAAGDFCGGKSDGNCFCDDQCMDIGDCCSDYVEVCLGEPTEEVSFEVAGYVAGQLLGNRADAEATWAEACQRWTDNLSSRFGPVTGSSCGDPENLSSSTFMFASRPRATLTATIPTGSELVESPGGRTAAGDLTANLEPAIASWSAACDAEIDRWRQVYGDRLVGAACPEPENLSSSSRLFESDVHLWLAPLAGDRVTGIDYAAGELTANLEPALASWRDACVAAVSVAAEIGDLEVAGCEPRENLASSSRLFASEIAVTFAGVSPVASQPPPIAGELIGNLGAALSSWRTACDNALRAIAERDGDRLVGGVCGVPANTSSSSFRFESQPTVWHQQ